MLSPTLSLPLDRCRDVDAAVPHFGVSGEAKEREVVSLQTVREEKRHKRKIKSCSGEERVAITPLSVPLQTGEGKMEEQEGKSEIWTSARSFLLPAHDGDRQEEGEEMLWCPDSHQPHRRGRFPPMQCRRHI